MSFSYKIICHKSSDKWYIRSQTNNCDNVKVGVHSEDLQIKPDHIPNKVDHMYDAVHVFINNCLKEQQSPVRISNLIFTQYNIVLPDSAISQYENKLMNSLMM